MKKRFVTGMLALTMVLGSAVVANAEEATGLKVGLALSDMSAPVFIQARNELEEMIEADGNELLICDAQADSANLVSGIENFVQAGCDIIILQNFAGEACNSVLSQAKDEGIVICSYDYENEYAAFNAIADNETLGKIIGNETGKWIAENYGDEAVEVALLDYPLMDFMVVRADAMVEGLHEYAPNAEVVIRLSAGFVDEGLVAGENILSANPDVKAIMGINDGGVLGAYQAFKAAGKSMEEDKIGMFGSDGSAEAAKAIKEEDMFLCTIDLQLVDVITGLYTSALEAIEAGETDAEPVTTYFPMVPTYLDGVAAIE